MCVDDTIQACSLQLNLVQVDCANSDAAWQHDHMAQSFELQQQIRVLQTEKVFVAANVAMCIVPCSVLRCHAFATLAISITLITIPLVFCKPLAQHTYICL